MEGGAEEDASSRGEAGWLEQRRREEATGRRALRRNHDEVEEARGEPKWGRAGSGGLGRWRRSRAIPTGRRWKRRDDDDETGREARRGGTIHGLAQPSPAQGLFYFFFPFFFLRDLLLSID